LSERGGERLWAATNGMILDYISATQSLRFGADGQVVMNPSALDVWLAVDGAAVRVPAGHTQRL
jgi:hypothetical protein